jgi:hypothetical protein
MGTDRDPPPTATPPPERAVGTLSGLERLAMERMRSDAGSESASEGVPADDAPVATLGRRTPAHRLLAWLLAGTALGIVALLWIVGYTGPPWTLEQLVIARAGAPRDAAPVSTRVTAALESDDVSEPMKLALVDELARDPGESATDALLHAARNPSLLISMAAVKGLTGRPCERLEPQLADLLVDEAWQRRAWAAKVLGESGCNAAGDALSDRWRSESDARVREQIADAMSALRAVDAQ